MGNEGEGEDEGEGKGEGEEVMGGVESGARGFGFGFVEDEEDVDAYVWTIKSVDSSNAKQSCK
jgi:hypothetical protein